jgi:hypothetical protein
MHATHAAGAACRALPWAALWGWLTHGPRGGGAPCRPTAAQALQGAYVPPAQAGRRLPPPGWRVRAGAHHPRGTRHGVHHQQASALGGGAGSAAQRRRRRRVPGGGGGGRQAAEGVQPRRISRGSRSAVRGHRRRPSPLSASPATGPSAARGGAGHSGSPWPHRAPLGAHKRRGVISHHPPQTAPL